MSSFIEDHNRCSDRLVLLTKPLFRHVVDGHPPYGDGVHGIRKTVGSIPFMGLGHNGPIHLWTHPCTRTLAGDTIYPFNQFEQNIALLL